MAKQSSRTPMAGGFLLAMSVMLGAIIGAMRGEASMGFVIGFGVGVALALAVWLLDRWRN